MRVRRWSWYTYWRCYYHRAGRPAPRSRPDLIDKFIRLQEAEGLKALEDAAAELKQYGISPHRTVLNGSAANRLMDHADGVGADLIAVGSGNKGRVEAFLIGSVGRKLVIGAKQSILIAKRKLAAEGPLTAVLATDHSDYANRCIDKENVEIRTIGRSFERPCVSPHGSVVGLERLLQLRRKPVEVNALVLDFSP